MQHQERKKEDAALEFAGALAGATDRRAFLRWAGVTVGVSIAAGCATEKVAAPIGAAVNADHVAGHGISLGSGDFLVLNFAYALEQLEAAFYTQVVAGSYYAGASAAERQILDDIRKHEVVHRNFLRDALGGNAIGALEVDFSSVNFASRTSVLTTARTFEDLGVSAYNGAGKYLTNLQYLLVAGKIVSVEARHAAAIRDLISPKSAAFAGDSVVNAQGLDVSRAPRAVYDLASPFIVTEIETSQLPTT